MDTQQMSVVDEIGHAVREHGDGAAVRAPHRTVSYRELGELTGEFAERLAARLSPGRFVGIEAERGAGAIVAMIGAMRAGRPFVFLDGRDSASSNARKAALLGVDLLARPHDEDVELAEVPAEWHGAASTEPIGEADICYAVHTSGSTGEPKCVLVRAAPLAPVIRDHVERLEVGPDSRTLQFARLTFDGCITEILWTLTAGGCLVIVDEERLTPGAVLRDTLVCHKITHLKTTPFALTATEPAPGMALTHVVNGGGACRVSVVRKWSEVAQFHNAYGTTETTVCNLLSDPLDPEDCGAAVPLGEPVGRCDCTVAENGELVVSGESVAAGYLTERGLVPFAGEYRTGDVVERRNGRLYFVQRIDRQTKVRGYRLDPGEVENAVCRLDSVADAVVTVESHDGTETGEPEALVCYYQGGPGPRELRQHLDTALEEYKIPSVLQQIDAFPYTGNGKVDREALRAGRMSEMDGSPTQQVLQFARTLTGVGDVGLDDNFFEVGGDSGSALALVGKIRELGWADAGVRDVLRAENLRALTDRLPERSG